MKSKIFILNILILSILLLIVPDLRSSDVIGQRDRSFAGGEAPFVPPSPAERVGSLPLDGFEFDDDGQGDDESIDKDEFPILTQQEINNFVSDDPDLIDLNRSNILDTTISSDPISSIVQEIVKNETIIKDEEDLSDSDLKSQIKFQNQDLAELLQAQDLAPEPENQTNVELNETEDEVPFNITDDFEIEEDEISLNETLDTEVIDFIDQTKNSTQPSVPPANETGIADETIDGEIQPSVPPANETGIADENIDGEIQPSVP
ncbi:MAG: hypothetical protein ACE5SW_12720, partial [Nitrososphaeraceae archaeon]